MTLSTLLSFFADHPVAIAAAVALVVFMVVVSSTWIIRENQSGLVIKKYGPALAPGRLVALEGEAGYQARMLPPVIPWSSALRAVTSWNSAGLMR